MKQWEESKKPKVTAVRRQQTAELFTLCHKASKSEQTLNNNPSAPKYSNELQGHTYLDFGVGGAHQGTMVPPMWYYPASPTQGLQQPSPLFPHVTMPRVEKPVLLFPPQVLNSILLLTKRELKEPKVNYLKLKLPSGDHHTN